MTKWVSLTLNKDFRRLYYKGKSSVHPMLVTYAMKNRLGCIRIGITTSKKVGCAVERNRARRVIRAAIRACEMPADCGWDFVFVARTKTASIKSTELEPVIKKHIETLTTNQNTAKAGK
ncbi:MAG: ribonuclease P protein component [Oscillospiraceae bacterium]|nr:ribonuclease P protein component [Oscillospiraceae bacterium]